MPSTATRNFMIFWGKFFLWKGVLRKRFFPHLFLTLKKKKPVFWPHFGERNFDYQNSRPWNPHFHPTHDIALQNLKTHVSKEAKVARLQTPSLHLKKILQMNYGVKITKTVSKLSSGPLEGSPGSNKKHKKCWKPRKKHTISVKITPLFRWKK